MDKEEHQEDQDSNLKSSTPINSIKNNFFENKKLTDKNETVTLELELEEGECEFNESSSDSKNSNVNVNWKEREYNFPAQNKIKLDRRDRGRAMARRNQNKRQGEIEVERERDQRTRRERDHRHWVPGIGIENSNSVILKSKNDDKDKDKHERIIVALPGLSIPEFELCSEIHILFSQLASNNHHIRLSGFEELKNLSVKLRDMQGNDHKMDTGTLSESVFRVIVNEIEKIGADDTIRKV